VHLTTLINLDHYIYETADMLLMAVAYTYLGSQDLEALEKISNVSDEIYEEFELPLDEPTEEDH